MDELVTPVYSLSRSRSPERRASPERRLSYARERSPPRSTGRNQSVEKVMSDKEFLALKNCEKRSYTKRMRTQNLLSEKHLVGLMQELLAQRIELTTLELDNTKVRLREEYQIASTLEISRKRPRSLSPLSPLSSRSRSPVRHRKTRSSSPSPVRARSRSPQRQLSPLRKSPQKIRLERSPLPLPSRFDRGRDTYFPLIQQQQQQTMHINPNYQPVMRNDQRDYNNNAQRHGLSKRAMRREKAKRTYQRNQQNQQTQREPLVFDIRRKEQIKSQAPIKHVEPSVSVNLQSAVAYDKQDNVEK